MAPIKQIIWDWNGTLLNDVKMCVEVMNTLLSKYSLPDLSCQKYKRIFDFPVKDYYSRLGFDFEKIPFDKVGHEFMDHYFVRMEDCGLFPEVAEVLEMAKRAGINQMVLSAMEHQSLERSLSSKGIRSFFSEVRGIDNHLAFGKSLLALELVKSSGFLVEETLFVGDTLHDLEIANAMGSRCALIADGHFSKDRLLAVHDFVFDDLNGFKIYLESRIV